MPIRKAEAEWNGNLKEGKGKVSVESGLFTDSNYSFAKRFGDEKGTNPEELIAAAHAACFSMAFSASLAEAGFPPKSVHTVDKAHLEKVGSGFAVTKMDVDCVAEVPGIDPATFLRLAEEAKQNCPISKALKGVELILRATLK